MARAPDERYGKAKELFLQGRKLVEIADQLNLPEGTIRRWKSTHHWDSERSGKNNERSDTKSERLGTKIKRPQKEKKSPIAQEIESVVKNEELNDNQRLFCLYYVRCFNATKAYQKAYNCSYDTAASIGYRLLEKDGVKKEITHLKKNRLNREMLSEEDIFQKYLDIAFADMSDYMDFGTEEVPVMSMHGPVQVKDEQTGKKKQLMKTVNFVRFKNSKEVDGTILSEVKQGKDGASIKLSDRMKALQWLSDHMDMATEKQRAEVALLKAKLDMDETGEDGSPVVNIYMPVKEEMVLREEEMYPKKEEHG